jgi:chromosome segregation ATPase
MIDEEPKLLTFTQEKLDELIEARLMRERDKHTETITTITAENETLKGKLTKIEVDGLIKEAGLAPEWAQKLEGKTPDEVKAEVQTIKALVEKSKPVNEPIGSDTNPANTTPTFFTRESIKNMTPQAINENWESIQKALKSGI